MQELEVVHLHLSSSLHRLHTLGLHLQNLCTCVYFSPDKAVTMLIMTKWELEGSEHMALRNHINC